jgi:hypothetical protein
MKDTKDYGCRKWLIPDGHIPSPGNEKILGHEAICFVNSGDRNANIKMTVYFEDKEPIREIPLEVKVERSLHVWLSKPEMMGGAVIPVETPYSILVESSENIVVQHTRVDTRLGNMALLSVIGYPVEE